MGLGLGLGLGLGFGLGLGLGLGLGFGFGLEISAACPSSEHSSTPLCTSHSLAVESIEPVATTWGGSEGGG